MKYIKLFEFFSKSDNSEKIRDKALKWWNGLTTAEREKYELDFFDVTSVGGTEDIDIESMYQNYVLNK
jgi:hypothetical protein